MNIGVIGGGAIAQFLFKKINEEKAINSFIKSVYVRNKTKYEFLHEQYGVKIYTNFDHFLKSDIDIIVEAANIEAVKQLIPKAIKQKNTIIISVGALADPNFSRSLYHLASTSNNTIHLPSGAIGGLDLLQNAHALNEITNITLTTRKPAHTLTDLILKDEKVIFKGSAAKAIKEFPENVNVSIILSLAGIGVNETKVKIIADPHIQKNNHTIDINGAFGKATINIENNPLKENPKTSYLAALSVLGTLHKLNKTIKIG